jgi:hypothetical protein
MRGVRPPMRMSSLIMYLPLGFTSAEDGDAFADAGEVIEGELDVHGVGHGEEVEDGVGRAAEGGETVMAFSKALRVMMSRGRMFFLMRLRTAAPALRQSLALLLGDGGWAELLGRLMPRASMAVAMVLAVYMPPQEPGPGMAQDSTS